MTVRDFGARLSACWGVTNALDLMTMSIGFSSTVSKALTATNAFWLLAGGTCSLTAACVMSASGTPCKWEGSGATDGLGVGNCEASSTATDVRVFLGGAALFRFLGEGLLVGDTGSGSVVDASASNICEGSTLSPVFSLRVRVEVWIVDETSVVFLLVWRLGLCCGAGVKSSSSSPPLLGSRELVPSESSSITLRRVGARRDGLFGDTADISFLQT